MTSPISTNKISYRQCILETARHEIWMMVLSVLANIILGPISTLYSINTRIDQKTARFHYICEYLNEIQLFSQVFIAFAGALIVGIFIFRFLFNRRMVDLYHSAPITRGKRFFCTWLTGFLIWFLPYIVCDILSGALLLALCRLPLPYVWKILGIYGANFFVSLLTFLMVYHVCLVAAMLSGNVLNAIVNSFTLGLIAFAAYMTYLFGMDIFFQSFYRSSLEVLTNCAYVLSPMAAPVLLCIHRSQSLGNNFYSALIIGGSLLSLLNVNLAFLIYRNRKSEISETGTPCKWIQTLFRCSLSFLGGLVISFFFIMVTSATNRFAWGIVTLVLGSIILFALLNIFYHYNCKSIICHKRQYCLVLCGALAVLFVGHFDLLGYESYLPKKDQIIGANIQIPRFMNYYYINMPTNDCIDSLEKEELTNSPLFTNSEAIYEILQTLIEDSDPDSYDSETEISYLDSIGNTMYYRNSETVYVCIHTRQGSYNRRYSIKDIHLEALRPFIENEEYIQYYYPMESDQLSLPDSITLGTKYQSLRIETPEKIRQLLDAYQADFRRNQTMEYLDNSISSMEDLCLNYINNQDDLPEWDRTESYYYGISPWHTETIALLNSWFPNIVLGVSDFTINSIDCYAFIDDYPGTTPLDILLAYFGYESDKTPITDIPFFTILYANGINRYNIPLTAKDIEEMGDNFRIGYFSVKPSDPYVECGIVTLSDGFPYPLYVKLGTLPTSLIDAAVPAENNNYVYTDRVLE